MPIEFGVGFPSCREGTAYPVPYVRPEEFPLLAQRAEELGFVSLWANDHLTTPNAIRATLDQPPNFYEPLVTYASLAYVTKKIRFLLGVIVVPERETILLAKQIATLDRLTNGRVTLGVGIGVYREEFQAVHPELKGANRGRMLEEGVEALRALFSERRASYQGTYVHFEDVELAPKPVQQPVPVVINAHDTAPLQRVGRMADGWLVAGLPLDQLASARQVVDEAARAAGRDPADISLHFQIWLSFGADAEQAEAKLKRSQHFRRLQALKPELSEEEHVARYRAGNLFGSPDDVIAQIRAFEAAGVDHMGVVFLGETTEELLADMQLFSKHVMPAFAPAAV